MGNRPSVQPSGPPPLLSAAVLGNLQNFGDSWTGEDSIDVQDAQGNNVLHALFSCRGAGKANCPQILERIHNCLPQSRWTKAYQARNAIGCTPLWILVAYGNVESLKVVRQKFEDAQQEDLFCQILQQPNHQGDSPVLATCSQGNIDMVRYMKEQVLSADQFSQVLQKSNQKGTTPLQIVVGNNHLELLNYLLAEATTVIQGQLLETNQQGLSLFHICSERNAHEMLQTMLSTTSNQTDLSKLLSLKDKNGANPLHVACFCGNEETAQVWIDAVLQCGKDTIQLLDLQDGQNRTAYWLAMLQGHDTIASILTEAGVDTSNPKMVKEIEEAKERKAKAAASRKPPIDGSALLNR